MDQQNMEQYWNYLRSMGLSEEAIEMYKKQIDLSSNWAGQLNQFSQNMQQFNQLFTGDDADAEGDDQPTELLLNDNTQLTKEQQWAVACGADVAFTNEQFLNDLTTGLGKQTCRQLLSEWWDIDSTEELEEMIAWLKESGHRMEYDLIWQALNTVSVKESKAFLREHVIANKLEEQTVMEHMRNTRDALELFRERELIDPVAQPEMLIWDYARIINLSRGGFDAGYFTQEQALEHIMEVVPAIKRVYVSWKHLSISYQFARCVWNGVDEDEFEVFRRNMDLLLTDPRSPWVTLLFI
jgi:hypothetical protein